LPAFLFEDERSGQSLERRTRMELRAVAMNALLSYRKKSFLFGLIITSCLAGVFTASIGYAPVERKTRKRVQEIRCF